MLIDTSVSARVACFSPRAAREILYESAIVSKNDLFAVQDGTAQESAVCDLQEPEA